MTDTTPDLLGALRESFERARLERAELQARLAAVNDPTCCAEFAETGTSHTEACCERAEAEARA